MMIKAASSIENQVKEFCALIGADPLLVQGAGGNVSWKDGDILWVKASGTWLAEAKSKEIFVPVNLLQLRDSLAKRDFFVKPEMIGSSKLRPSIETLLHALMPHRVVVHLHAIEALAHLVQIDAQQRIQDVVGDEFQWIFVDYYKPGVDLAREISIEVLNKPDVDVVFMGSHGLVIGADGVGEVAKLLRRLTSKLKVAVQRKTPQKILDSRQADLLTRGYVPCGDREVSLLATNGELLDRVRYEWALYPDHVVFLGSDAAILEGDFATYELDKLALKAPSHIVVSHDDVYESPSATQAQRAQLRCYFDVLARQSSSVKLRVLNKQQVSELLDWDAEKYRSSVDDG